MNLYEFEGKRLFQKYGIKTPKSIVVRRGEDFKEAYYNLNIKDVVVKAQVLSGKRGKNNGIKFCSSADDVEAVCNDLFDIKIKNQYVVALLIEEKLDILEEHYISITYDTGTKNPVLVYSKEGGMDVEDVDENLIEKINLDVRLESIEEELPFAKELWKIFLEEDCRLVEINPLVKTQAGNWYAADSKIALDEDAFFRHQDRKFEPRTMLGRPPTEREVSVREIDGDIDYYRGTAGKYIEMDGDIAVLFSGGGASIANMDALIKAGLKPANYTEYSGNPPREKVYKLTKVVLSKPGIKGLWIAGGVANFTDIAETFGGIVDALDEIKTKFPIVVRRAGPNEEEGKKIMLECARRNNIPIKIFGKETSMSDTARELAEMINNN